MADTGPPKRVAVYPAPNVPVIFVDGIANIAHSSALVKLYMMRADPSITTTDPPQARVVSQIIMPMSAFLNAFVFFERIVADMKEQEVVSDADLEAMRNQLKADLDAA